MLLGYCIGPLYGIDIAKSIGNELLFSDGGVLGTTLGAMDGISLGIYYGTVVRSL